MSSHLISKTKKIKQRKTLKKKNDTLLHRCLTCSVNKEEFKIVYVIFQNGQTHFKNLSAAAPRFLKLI